MVVKFKVSSETLSEPGHPEPYHSMPRQFVPFKDAKSPNDHQPCFIV